MSLFENFSELNFLNLPEPHHSVLSRRRQIKRTQKKFGEIHFYDDSDDEDFVDVEPDKNEAELLYMQLELEKEEPKKKTVKRKGNGFVGLISGVIWIKVIKIGLYTEIRS